MPRARIVVVGSCNMDMFTIAERLPGRGETVLGRGFQMSPGGKGANQAVAAARAGSEVFLVANAGDDIFGHELIGSLTRERVAIDFISQDRANPTGVATIIIDSQGDNMIAVSSGANMALTTHQVDKAVTIIQDAGFVLIQMEIPIEVVRHTLELAWRLRVPVMLNAAPAPREPFPQGFLSKVDTLVVNEHEAAVLAQMDVTDAAGAERAARALQGQGAQRVVVTLGAKGALGLAYETVLARGREVEVVDTVGAGDAFCGALATALAEGEVFADAVNFANAAAALACTKVGAQTSLPSRVDIESVLRA